MTLSGFGGTIAMAGSGTMMSGTLTLTAGVSGPETRTLLTALSVATTDALRDENAIAPDLAERINRAVSSAVSAHVTPLTDQVDRLAAIVVSAQASGLLENVNFEDLPEPDGDNTTDDSNQNVTLDELYDLLVIIANDITDAVGSRPQPTIIDWWTMAFNIILVCVALISLI
jgi:hypothetical protein